MKFKRNVYLRMKTLDEAKAVIKNFEFKNVLSSETILVTNSIGRSLSEPVYAKLSSPNYNAAAMDGIAVNAELTFGTSETKPKNLVIGKEAFYVNTGQILPKNTNAIIMIEHVYL